MDKIVFSWTKYLRLNDSLYDRVESASVPDLLGHIYPDDLIERLPPPCRRIGTSIAEKLKTQHRHFYSDSALEDLYHKDSLSLKTKRIAKFVESSLHRLLEPGGFHAFFIEQMIPAMVEFFVDLLKTPVTSKVTRDLSPLRLNTDVILAQASAKLRSEVEWSHSRFLVRYILGYLRKIVEIHDVDGVSELRLRPKEAVVASFTPDDVYDLLSPLVTPPKVGDFSIDDERCLVFKCAVLSRRDIAKEVLGLPVLSALNHASGRQVAKMAAEFSQNHRQLCLEVIEWLDSKVVIPDFTDSLVESVNTALCTSFPGIFTRFNLEAAYGQLSASMPLTSPITTESLLENIEFIPESMPFIDALVSHLHPDYQHRIFDFQRALLHSSIFFYFHYVVHWIRRIKEMTVWSGGSRIQYILRPREDADKKQLLEKTGIWITNRKSIREDRKKQNAEKQPAASSAIDGFQHCGGTKGTTTYTSAPTQTGCTPAKGSKATDAVDEDETIDGDAAKRQRKKSKERGRLQDFVHAPSDALDVDDTENLLGTTQDLFSPCVTSPKISDFEIDDERCFVLQSAVCSSQEVAEIILGSRVFAALTLSSKEAILDMTTTFISKHRKICLDMAFCLKSIKAEKRTVKTLVEDIRRLVNKLAAAFYTSFPGLFARHNLEAAHRHFVSKLPLKSPSSNEVLFESLVIQFNPETMPFIEDLGSRLCSGHEDRLAAFQKALLYNSIYFYFHYSTHWFRRLGQVFRSNDSKGPRYVLEWRSEEEREELLEKSSHWTLHRRSVRDWWLKLQEEKHAKQSSESGDIFEDDPFEGFATSDIRHIEVSSEYTEASEATAMHEATGEAAPQKNKKPRKSADSGEAATEEPKFEDAAMVAKKDKKKKKVDSDEVGVIRAAETPPQESSIPFFTISDALYGISTETALEDETNGTKKKKKNRVMVEEHATRAPEVSGIDKEETLLENPKATETAGGDDTAGLKKTEKKKRPKDADPGVSVTSNEEDKVIIVKKIERIDSDAEASLFVATSEELSLRLSDFVKEESLIENLKATDAAKEDDIPATKSKKKKNRPKALTYNMRNPLKVEDQVIAAKKDQELDSNVEGSLCVGAFEDLSQRLLDFVKEESLCENPKASTASEQEESTGGDETSTKKKKKKNRQRSIESEDHARETPIVDDETAKDLKATKIIEEDKTSDEAAPNEESNVEETAHVVKKKNKKKIHSDANKAIRATEQLSQGGSITVFTEGAVIYENREANNTAEEDDIPETKTKKRKKRPKALNDNMSSTFEVEDQAIAVKKDQELDSNVEGSLCVGASEELSQRLLDFVKEESLCENPKATTTFEKEESTGGDETSTKKKKKRQKSIEFEDHARETPIVDDVMTKDLKATKITEDDKTSDEAAPKKKKKHRKSEDNVIEESNVEETAHVVKKKNKKKIHSDANEAIRATEQLSQGGSITVFTEGAVIYENGEANKTAEEDEVSRAAAKKNKKKKRKRERAAKSDEDAIEAPKAVEKEKVMKVKRKKKDRHSESDLEIIDVTPAEEVMVLMQRKRKRPCEVIDLSSDDEAPQLPLLPDEAWERKWKLEEDRLARDKEVPAMAMLALQTVLENSRRLRLELKMLGS